VGDSRLVALIVAGCGRATLGSAPPSVAQHSAVTANAAPRRTCRGRRHLQSLRKAASSITPINANLGQGDPNIIKQINANLAVAAEDHQYKSGTSCGGCSTGRPATAGWRRGAVRIRGPQHPGLVRRISARAPLAPDDPPPGRRVDRRCPRSPALAACAAIGRGHRAERHPGSDPRIRPQTHADEGSQQGPSRPRDDAGRRAADPARDVSDLTAIIEHLQQDGRRPFTQIAADLGVSRRRSGQGRTGSSSGGSSRCRGDRPLKLGFQQMAMIGIRCEANH